MEAVGRVRGPPSQATARQPSLGRRLKGGGGGGGGASEGPAFRSYGAAAFARAKTGGRRLKSKMFRDLKFGKKERQANPRS